MTAAGYLGPVNAMLNIYLFFAFMTLCCGYALWHGGAPERAAACIALAGAIGSLVAALLFPSEGMRIYFGEIAWTLVIDLAMLIAWVVLAVWSTRYWPILVAACQGMLVASSLAVAAMLIHPWAYWVLQMMWSYPIPLLIALGALRHRRRLRSAGTDISWKPFLRW
ncbi:hypothetical protein ACPVPU_01735 [Sphingomonas sp. CJ99]